MYVYRFHISILRPTNLTVGMGAAYGTAKAGIGIAGVGTYRPDLIMKVWILTTVFQAIIDRCL